MKADEKKCPKCAEAIKKEALVCKHCGQTFSQSEVAATLKHDADSKRNGAIGCLLLIVALVAVAKCSSGGDKSATSETSTAETKVEAEKKDEDLRKGFHCLSGWDGANRSLKDQVKNALRNPSSFEHIETRIAPVNKEGKHPIFMKYRAENGFGGMNVENAAGFVDPASCDAVVIAAGVR